jgi:AI-2E family transporter
MVAWAQDIGGKAALVLSDAIWLVLIPILAIFFLRDGQKMAEQTIRMADVRRHRVLVRGIVDDIDVMLAGYIRAQLLLAGLSLIVYTGVLLMMRVPYARDPRRPRWNRGVRSGSWTIGSGAIDIWRSLPDELFPPMAPLGLSGRLETGTGLLQFSAHHGWQSGTASPCSAVRNSGRR